MRRRSAHIFLLIERTVPMLFAIGAVLSVLLFFFPGSFALALGACSLWLLAAVASGIGLYYRLISAKKQEETAEEEGEKDRFL